MKNIAVELLLLTFIIITVYGSKLIVSPGSWLSKLLLVLALALFLISIFFHTAEKEEE
jgi:thiol:disulfide interchange protein